MKPPKRLTGKARAKWVEVFARFRARNAMDTELACQYCEAFDLYLTAKETWQAEGVTKSAGKNGAPYQHPAVGVMNKAQETMERIYKLLSDKLGTDEGEDELD